MSEDESDCPHCQLSRDPDSERCPQCGIGYDEKTREELISENDHLRATITELGSKIAEMQQNPTSRS
jgi:uncharacterized paraquat-inducible protein A